MHLKISENLIYFYFFYFQYTTHLFHTYSKILLQLQSIKLFRIKRELNIY